MKKYLLPIGMFALFETVAIMFYLAKGNPFYLFNFSYIGISIAFGIFLFTKKHANARRVAQLLVGLYMLVYLKGFGITFLLASLKQQLSITQWPKF